MTNRPNDHDETTNSTRPPLTWSLGSILELYISKLRDSGNDGVDNALISIRDTVFELKRLEPAAHLNWADIQDKLRLHDFDRTFDKEELVEHVNDAMAMEMEAVFRGPADVSDSLSLWYGDWFGIQYHLRFESSIDGIKPILRQIPPDPQNRIVKLAINDIEYGTVALNARGECNHTECPQLATDMLDTSELITLKFEDGNTISLKKRNISQ